MVVKGISLITLFYTDPSGVGPPVNLCIRLPARQGEVQANQQRGIRAGKGAALAHGGVLPHRKAGVPRPGFLRPGHPGHQDPYLLRAQGLSEAGVDEPR